MQLTRQVARIWLGTGCAFNGSAFNGSAVTGEQTFERPLNGTTIITLPLWPTHKIDKEEEEDRDHQAHFDKKN